MIKALIFDNNGVLTGTEEEALHLLSEMAGVSKSEFEAVWKEEAKRVDDGTVATDVFLANLARQFGIEDKLDEVKNIYLDQYVRNDEMHKEVQDLSNRFKVAMLSNFGDKFAEFDEKWRSNEIFGDNIFVSAMLGMRKPNRDIFEYALSKLAVEPHEAVFIDDRKENVEAALALGMQGIVFESREQFKKELEEIKSLEKQNV